jgi:hypothetical protein
MIGVSRAILYFASENVVSSGSIQSDSKDQCTGPNWGSRNVRNLMGAPGVRFESE